MLLPFDISADVLGKSGLCPPADNVRLVGQGTFQPPGPELGMKAGCRARSNNIDTAIAEAKFGIFEIARQKGPSEAKSFRAHLRYAVVPPLVWTRGWRSMMLLDRAECFFSRCRRPQAGWALPTISLCLTLVLSPSRRRPPGGEGLH